MSTWGQLRMILSTSAPGIPEDLLDSYLNNRYEQILEKAEWMGLNMHSVIRSIAAYSSGADHATLTEGQSIVVGTGTSWIASQAGLRFYVPGDTAVYTVASVEGPLALTLDRTYEARGTDVAGTVYALSSYVLMQNIYLLPTDVRTVVDVLSPITGLPMQRFSRAELAATSGTRAMIGEPQCYAVYDDSPEGAVSPVLHRIEFYPPPSYARGFDLEYVHEAVGFDGGSTANSPFPWIGDSVLLYGCQADISMHLARHAAPGEAASHRGDAKNYEAKFQEGLASALRVEYQQRRPLSAVKMADRFTRHRMNRANRGYNNTWGIGRGGPN